MTKLAFVHILSPQAGQRYASFYLYLPAGEETYTQYRFLYAEHPANPSLTYTEGPNDPANSAFYRIVEAYIGKLEGETFTPDFRALQGGEIGLAFREEGAGDHCGGYHGDEVLYEVQLTADGRELFLDRPQFCAVENLTFAENSIIFRCNTPTEQLLRHQQIYTIADGTLFLEQRLEWLADAKVLDDLFSPMLTAQRRDPQRPDRILGETVEFYDHPGGACIASCDTTPYGAGDGTQYAENACEDTPATAVRVYGKESGFSAEAGYWVLEDSIPRAQQKASLCIRYGALDNKIYFDLGGGTSPKTGEVWKIRAYYRLRYHAPTN